jgi:hypothetical protein
VLGDPDVFLISASDIHLLPRVLEAAARAESRPPDTEMEQLRAGQQMQPIFRGSEGMW